MHRTEARPSVHMEEAPISCYRQLRAWHLLYEHFRSTESSFVPSERLQHNRRRRLQRHRVANRKTVRPVQAMAHR